MDEILVVKTTEKTGENKRGPWARYGVMDEAEQWYSVATWSDSFKKEWVPLLVEGQRLQIEYVSEPYDGRIQRNLTAVEAVGGAENGAEPKLGDGSYVKGRENPGTQRSISASVALQQAVASMTHTIRIDMTPKDASLRVLPLASEYYRWLLQRAGLETDEDIPF